MEDLCNVNFADESTRVEENSQSNEISEPERNVEMTASTEREMKDSNVQTDSLNQTIDEQEAKSEHDQNPIN